MTGRRIYQYSRLQPKQYPGWDMAKVEVSCGDPPILGLSDDVVHGAVSVSAAIIVRSSFARMPPALAPDYKGLPKIPQISTVRGAWPERNGGGREGTR